MKYYYHFKVGEIYIQKQNNFAQITQLVSDRGGIQTQIGMTCKQYF